MLQRFDGAIAGIGTASGIRLVVGMWPVSPFGGIVDVMIERPDGHRVLIAPRPDVAAFIATTYNFDEVRIEPTSMAIVDRRWMIDTATCRVTMHTGRRTAAGQLLSLVPRALA